jgi:hypothetical protein
MLTTAACRDLILSRGKSCLWRRAWIFKLLVDPLVHFIRVADSNRPCLSKLIPASRLVYKFVKAMTGR